VDSRYVPLLYGLFLQRTNVPLYRSGAQVHFPVFVLRTTANGTSDLPEGGHILEYFVLGVLAWRAITSAPFAWIRPEFLTLALVVAVALSDEFHQSFVPSRTSALGDVGFDVFGV
jgi:hypothetical protein